jgi:hypothetical protein
MAKEKMAKAGYDQGDMSPKVESYQRPEASFAEGQFGTTTEYIERQDRFIDKEAKEIRKQGYKGRYS